MKSNSLEHLGKDYNFNWWRCAGSNRSLKTAYISVYMLSKVEKFHSMTTQLPKAIIKLRFKISLQVSINSSKIIYLL